MVLASNFNSSETRSVKRERKGSLLMYASIPTTYLSGFSMYSFFFSVFSFLFFLPPFPFVPPFSLFTVTPFYTIYRGGICHFYPSTAFGSLWTSFQNCLLIGQLLSHYHCSECDGCTTLHLKQNCLSCFLHLSVFHLPRPNND